MARKDIDDWRRILSGEAVRHLLVDRAPGTIQMYDYRRADPRFSWFAWLLRDRDPVETTLSVREAAMMFVQLRLGRLHAAGHAKGIHPESIVAALAPGREDGLLAQVLDHASAMRRVPQFGLCESCYIWQWDECKRPYRYHRPASDIRIATGEVLLDHVRAGGPHDRQGLADTVEVVLTLQAMRAAVMETWGDFSD